MGTVVIPFSRLIFCFTYFGVIRECSQFKWTPGKIGRGVFEKFDPKKGEGSLEILREIREIRKK